MSSFPAPDDAEVQPPGWYHAVGDPAETVRYWDGGSWWGEPQESFTGAAPQVRAVSSARQRRTGTVLPAAGLPRRVTAAAVDLSVYGAAVVFIGGLWDRQRVLVEELKTVPTEFDTALLVRLWVTVLVLLMLPALVEFVGLAAGGTSLGKRLFAVAVVKRRGAEVPSWRSAAARASVKLVVVPMVGFMAVTGIWMISSLNRSAQVAFVLFTAAVVCVPVTSARRRAIWDAAAGTEVVSARSDHP